MKFENFNNIKNPSETKDILFSIKDSDEIFDVPFGGGFPGAYTKNKKIDGVESPANFGRLFTHLNISKEGNLSQEDKEKINKLKLLFAELKIISPNRPLIDLACGVEHHGVDVALALNSNAYVGVDIKNYHKKDLIFSQKYFNKIFECHRFVFGEDRPDNYHTSPYLFPRDLTESHINSIEKFIEDNISSEDAEEFRELFKFYRINDLRHGSVRLKNLEETSEKFPGIHYVRDDILEFMRKLPDNLSANLLLSAIDANYDENFKELLINFKRVLSKDNLLIFYGPIVMDKSFPGKDDSDLSQEFEKISEINGIKVSDIHEDLYIYKKIK